MSKAKNESSHKSKLNKERDLKSLKENKKEDNPYNE